MLASGIRKLKLILRGNSKEAIKVKLLGKNIKAIPGTVREKVDQDDAWYYFLAKNASKIFDIGANTGYTALLTLVEGEPKRMVLIDANPEALGDAAKNLLTNNLGENCSFYAGFVGDKPSNNIKFYTVGTGAAGSMYGSHAKTAKDLEESIEVTTTTIDHLVKFYGVEPDFIKVDVEGAEYLVLKGASELAVMAKTRFLIEMHSPQELPMIENATLVLKWCKENDFEAWYLKDQAMLEDANVIAHRGKCHLLLQPKGWPYPEYLKGIKQRAPLPK